MLCLSMPTPGFPHFYYILGANLGSLLHGDVSAMLHKIYTVKMIIGLDRVFVVFVCVKMDTF